MDRTNYNESISSPSRFDPADFNKKCDNLLRKGFREYLVTIEDGVTHAIYDHPFTGKWAGWIVDVYDDGRIVIFKPKFQLLKSRI